MRKNWLYLALVIITGSSLQGCKKWSETAHGSLVTVINKGGQTLVYDTATGVRLIYEKGFAFKDLNKNGILDKYEDWRLDAGERSADLASRLSIEQIAGLMLYSAHQSIPAGTTRFMGGTYNGKPFPESGANAYDLSDQQVKFLTDDNVRHVLVTRVQSPEIAALWNNRVQALCESIGFGIPANNSSDPRHQATSTAEYNVGSEGQISLWPGSLGMAATFDPSVVKQFGTIASEEYRALGISTALSPQIDLGTEPRWARFSGTFGESPILSTDMARAYVDGFQTSSGEKEIKDGWGYKSVNAMIKHWPGGGPEEGGRDAHFSFGKYAVYPGNNMLDHLMPFTEGGLKLEGATKMASAIMPYYTISYGLDTVNGENVGNSYSKYLINDLLRGKYGFDGVACTDWGVTQDNPSVNSFGTTSWGVESLTVAERHYKAIMAGMDQFGGNNDKGPVVEAYNMGVKEHGEAFMRSRFEESAVRLLKNIFRTGLFENPYLDAETTKKTVGNAEFMKAGFEAQLKSVVMLKNKDKALPLAKEMKVYIPKRHTPEGRDFFGGLTPASDEYPISIEITGKYFKVAEKPEDADFALVVIRSPMTGGGYDPLDIQKGGNGYVPVSLQYGPYTASEARDTSLAGGDPLEKFTNRTYKNKTVTATNLSDLKMVLDTRRAMKNKPLIVVVDVSKPMVFSEFEKETDAIIVTFGVQDQAVLEIISGAFEPSGMLPFQMPDDMNTVEHQKEDVPFDMTCFKDSQGNIYDFGFGLNWNGVISDARTDKYVKSK
jgi:beta-glucosidase